MPIATDDLANLIGYLGIHTGKITAFLTVLSDPNATPAAVTDAQNQIATELQGMDKMITTILTAAQIVQTSTPYTDKDLQNMSLIAPTSTPIADTTQATATPSSTTAAVEPTDVPPDPAPQPQPATTAAPA